ncbi:hypothetical protein GCM10023231_16170 [Olivibacter ginsenosidimutans]|uniref:PorT family protein n=1 Tax=Olivibacter ginsenosidimutans TaxID=1176537 RepID=A0ABP9B1M2_9SPHI
MNKSLFLVAIGISLWMSGLAQQQRFRLLAKDSTQTKVRKYTDTIHNSKVYIVSGSLGYGIPIGSVRDVLTARLASSWGMDISLPNRHYVLYPSIDYWTFGYNQKNKNDESAYLIENGRANYYNVNLSIGTRRQFQKLNTYITIGPSVGIFFEPRADILPGNILRNDYDGRLMGGAKLNAGADYKLKGFFIYTDFGLMHAFAKIQDKPLTIFSFYIGLKTDITQMADQVVTVFEKKNKK